MENQKIKLPPSYDWIEINPEFEFALDQILNTKNHLNVIGPAGVGKSTLIKLISDPQVLKGETVVLATTGIAAVNASSHDLRATTLHAFFGLKPLNFYAPGFIKIRKDFYEVMNSIDNLVIDEASMMNSSLFDYIIETLLQYRVGREKDLPRIFLFNDPFQLSPVIPNDPDTKRFFKEMYSDKTYYFNSNSFRDLGFKTIHLNTIYRQKNTSLQNVLNRVRQAQHTQEDLNILNERVMPESQFFDVKDFYIYIALANQDVSVVNDSALEVLPGKMYSYHASISGEFDSSIAKQLQSEVKLKEECQIMVTKNDPQGTYQNGTLGKVIHCYADSVDILTEGGENLNIPRGDWTQYKYVSDTEGKLKLTEVGKFNQILVKGASALTFHKTQGLTLKAGYLDLGSWIGMPSILYVGLSRFRDLESFGLSRKIRMNDIKVNKEVLDFMERNI